MYVQMMDIWRKDVTDDNRRPFKRRKAIYDHAIVIGPMIMMKFASKKCRENNIPNTVSTKSFNGRWNWNVRCMQSNNRGKS